MSEKMLVRYCSPTLAGLKTGNLFNCSFKCLNELNSKITIWNSILNPKGVSVYLLNLTYDKALIYVYRPTKLMSDLSHDDVREILQKIGYNCSSIDECIQKLSYRIKNSNEFPHEIGLFLGYPLLDVKGFMENKGKNCKCVGCWKVYNDECNAQKIFAKYKKCTDVYCRKLTEGLSILRLTVAA